MSLLEIPQGHFIIVFVLLLLLQSPLLLQMHFVYVLENKKASLCNLLALCQCLLLWHCHSVCVHLSSQRLLRKQYIFHISVSGISPRTHTFSERSQKFAFPINQEWESHERETWIFLVEFTGTQCPACQLTTTMWAGAGSWSEFTNWEGELLGSSTWYNIYALNKVILIILQSPFISAQWPNALACYWWPPVGRQRNDLTNYGLYWTLHMCSLIANLLGKADCNLVLHSP